MHQGNLLLVLHAHLPFVRHPEHPEFLEEDWLYEAITETYLPILAMAEDLAAGNVGSKFSIALSPPLCEMLADPMLQDRYVRRLHKLIDLAGREVVRTAHEPLLNASARMYAESFGRARHVFEEKYGKNILRGFRRLQDEGRLEILTCGATHGFLPLIGRDEAVRAQIAVAARNYEKHFGRRPEGIWLPECGFKPGHDAILAAEGITHFFVDTHGILYATPRPRYTVFAPIRTPAGPWAFGRDLESSRQVWSANEGYPGDAAYREFYRDLGYDGDYESIRPWLHSDGLRRNIGVKYHRITGKVALDQKAYYDPDAAREKADLHAGNFLFNRQAQARHLHGVLGIPPTLVSPYDAELFGHWWFEGPRFLHSLLLAASSQDEIRFATPRDIVHSGFRAQPSTPIFSTWGNQGFADVWLNSTNDWIYRHQHVVEDQMVDLARTRPGASGLARRALNQAARETLLAESSDWAFIMNAGTTVPYAHKRFKTHVNAFLALASQIRSNQVDELFLADLENRHNCFSEIDYAVFA